MQVQATGILAQAVQVLKPQTAVRAGGDSDGDNDAASEASEASRSAGLASIGIGQNIDIRG